MFNIGDKVKGCIDDTYRIGTIDSINIAPGSKIVTYMVFFRSINECIELFEDEILPYKHEHISTSFSRKTNEEG